VSGEEAVRPDRHILLELDALLAQIEKLAADGGRDRYDTDDHYRWVLHRLWIAVGNEALAYARLTGRNVKKEQPWARLHRLRNMLAHDRLPDIDEHEVWRMSVVRPAGLRAQVRDLLN
jgi:uncharacterized protein with HEPN domain